MTNIYQEQTPLHWANKAYHTLDFEMKRCFGKKIVKLSLDGGFSCPNRDGTLDTRGCIFCSEVGSGDFSGTGTPLEVDFETSDAPCELRRVAPLAEQIRAQKQLLADKWPNAAYIAYFQNFTNTYASVEALKNLYEQVLADPDVVGIAIATRPDAISDEALDYLTELHQRTFLWVELGLQTTDDERAYFLNRGYTLEVFEKCHAALKARGIRTVLHLIAGLPEPGYFEHSSLQPDGKLYSGEDFMAAMAAMNMYRPWGLKIHLLHVLKNTRLHTLYQQHPFPLPDCDTYLQLLATSLEKLHPDIVVHRVTGDAPKALMVEPWWSLNKRTVLNGLDRTFKQRSSWQGKNYTP